MLSGKLHAPQGRAGCAAKYCCAPYLQRRPTARQATQILHLLFLSNGPPNMHTLLSWACTEVVAKRLSTGEASRAQMPASWPIYAVQGTGAHAAARPVKHKEDWLAPGDALLSTYDCSTQQEKASGSAWSGVLHAGGVPESAGRPWRCYARGLLCSTAQHAERLLVAGSERAGACRELREWPGLGNALLLDLICTAEGFDTWRPLLAAAADLSSVKLKQGLGQQASNSAHSHTTCCLGISR